MAKYMKFKSRKFVLEKDAIAWAKAEKKPYKGSSQKIKIETNYLEGLDQWEAVLYMKMETT